jgi:hypothetical protein
MARRRGRPKDDGLNGLRILGILVVMLLLGTPLAIPVSRWIGTTIAHLVLPPQVWQAANRPKPPAAR